MALHANDMEAEKCKKEGKEWSSATLRGGAKAGNFSLLKRTRSMADCKELCCGKNSCEVALLVGQGCYAVQCESVDACTPQTVKRSKIAPRIFVRSFGETLFSFYLQGTKLTIIDFQYSGL